jgi:hypothetical protein
MAQARDSKGRFSSGGGGGSKSSKGKSAAKAPKEFRNNPVEKGRRGESQATKRERAVRIGEKRLRQAVSSSGFSSSFKRAERQVARASKAQTKRSGPRLPGI